MEPVMINKKWDSKEVHGTQSTNRTSASEGLPLPSAIEIFRLIQHYTGESPSDGSASKSNLQLALQNCLKKVSAVPYTNHYSELGKHFENSIENDSELRKDYSATYAFITRHDEEYEEEDFHRPSPSSIEVLCNNESLRNKVHSLFIQKFFDRKPEVVTWFENVVVEDFFTDSLAQAEKGDLSLLKNFINEKKPVSERAIKILIRHRELDTLKQVPVRSLLISYDFCDIAVETGQLTMLQWLLSQNAPYDHAQLYRLARNGGHDDILKWLQDCGRSPSGPGEWGKYVSSDQKADEKVVKLAMNKGNLNLLKWALDHGAPRPKDEEIAQASEEVQAWFRSP